MIKIAELLATHGQGTSTAAADALPAIQQQENKDGAQAAVPAYPSKKLALKDGQYVVDDHKS